jgi:hypothetical protein
VVLTGDHEKYGLSVGVMEDISNLGACDAKMSRKHALGESGRRLSNFKSVLQAATSHPPHAF